MKTLYLDPASWDLVADASGNIALASNPYSLAQDAASETLTFKGEVYYDTTRGLPYWQQDLGQWPPLPLVKSQLAQAALLVPEVTSARVFFISLADRQLTGQVQITSTSGQVEAVSYRSPGVLPVEFGGDFGGDFS